MTREYKELIEKAVQSLFEKRARAFRKLLGIQDYEIRQYPNGLITFR